MYGSYCAGVYVAQVVPQPPGQAVPEQVYASFVPMAHSGGVQIATGVAQMNPQPPMQFP